MADITSKLLIGCREWITIPSLNLPSIIARVDTGAKTSALHAVDIETFMERGQRHARFFVYPRRRGELSVECVAPVVDRRTISDSGGHRELRWIVEADFLIGAFLQTIEITLTNRESMSYRMLVGRSALKYFLIDPTKSFMLGRPESKSKPAALKQRKSARKKT